jgi:hypothetical protein
MSPSPSRHPNHAYNTNPKAGAVCVTLCLLGVWGSPDLLLLFLSPVLVVGACVEVDSTRPRSDNNQSHTNSAGPRASTVCAAFCVIQTPGLEEEGWGGAKYGCRYISIGVKCYISKIYKSGKRVAQVTLFPLM